MSRKAEAGISQAIVRGELGLVDEASVSVEDSHVGTAQIVIGTDDCLSRMAVDLTATDAREMRDDLDRMIESESKGESDE